LAQNQPTCVLEASVKYAFVRSAGAPLSMLQAFAGYAYSHFRYDDFKSDNNNNAQTINYDGKKVVGVQNHVYDAGIDAASGVALYANTSLLVIGAMPLTFDNAHNAK